MAPPWFGLNWSSEEGFPVTAVTKVVLIIEYEGTRYHGFQLQLKLPTIQQELERALAKLTGGRRRVVAASRTDAGVHARGQVVSFRTTSKLPETTFVTGLNHYLPEDIAVRAAYRVDDSFHVQRDAVSREYRYQVLNRKARSPLERLTSYLVSGRLDIAAMNGAFGLLLGEHDLASFASRMELGERNTVKNVLRVGVAREGEMVVFDMVANSFLPHQVRNTVGLLLRVGLGRVDTSKVRDIMEVGEPGLAGPTAPACGLCLERVNYAYPFEEMR
ncbi:MAG: tRNA pseudouridine(38-40) synthase TruA [Dehalococcoidales bacterium]|nr:tRNA pseudouridine(38-40) synthase TruA [Dehalococcoidales bacterium]